MSNQAFYERYARLAVQMAVPIQAGQRLLIVSPPEVYELAQMIAEAAYQAGAAAAEVLYEDATVQELRIRSASADQLTVFPAWMAAALTEHAQAAQPILTLHAAHLQSGPGGLGNRVALAAAARNAALEEYGMRRSRVQFNWSVMAVATPAWARHLYPEASPEVALENLWATLSRLLRLDQPDPSAAWQEHAQRLTQRCAALDQLEIESLHFSGPGTDLEIGLPTGHQWFGPSVSSALGITGIPNMPTEEVSTLPHRLQTNGHVQMTRPLIINGQRIDDLELSFEGGRLSHWRSSSAGETLEHLLATDEGALRLGEVALVSEESLVAREHKVFYSTLIDENASCHLALGRAYPVTLKGGGDLSAAEFEAAGGNHSRVHLDFMVGSPELQVTARTRGGGEVVIMRSGKWV
ncbi:aminopeptidase (plasmid) [Deinococcus psychrotolerans]|uniref:Aminopeptidase n=1 Tax=Deinococcus psychrotolerans TaxID=2489213 RepID=A0A3G8YJ50_9DEIO|nr:aminopeptidase [Deinococcus psychrotolerans]AZI44993.1 aminopeptidase [Deinococcus psychrotolerans]